MAKNKKPIKAETNKPSTGSTTTNQIVDNNDQPSTDSNQKIDNGYIKLIRERIINGYNYQNEIDKAYQMITGDDQELNNKVKRMTILNYNPD